MEFGVILGFEYSRKSRRGIFNYKSLRYKLLTKDVGKEAEAGTRRHGLENQHRLRVFRAEWSGQSRSLSQHFHTSASLHLSQRSHAQRRNLSFPVKGCALRAQIFDSTPAFNQKVEVGVAWRRSHSWRVCAKSERSHSHQSSQTAPRNCSKSDASPAETAVCSPIKPHSKTRRGA